MDFETQLRNAGINSNIIASIMANYRASQGGGNNGSGGGAIRNQQGYNNLRNLGYSHADALAQSNSGRPNPNFYPTYQPGNVPGNFTGTYRTPEGVDVTMANGHETGRAGALSYDEGYGGPNGPASTIPRFDATNTAIGATSLGSTKPINLPTKNSSANYGSVFTGANSGLVNPKYGISSGENGNFNIDNGTDSFQALFEKYMGSAEKAPSATDIYNSLPEKAAYESALRNSQNYAAQINTINAQKEADKLSTIGQGRGIPEAIIGGQQAQIDKEAAIKALPLQALLANAQGNVELAQSHLDTVYKLRMQDAQNDFDYKKEMRKSIYDFASAEEQRKLDAQDKKDNRSYDMLKDSINFAQSLSLKAMENGDAATAAKFWQIPVPDANSKTLAADIKKYNTSIGKLQAGMGGIGGKTPEIKSINGVDYQWNSATKQWEVPKTPGGTSIVSPDVQKENAQDFQFAKQSRDSVMSLVQSVTGKTDLSQLTKADMSKFNDTQAEVISKALSITANPKSTRATGGEDALGPNSWFEKVITNPIRQTFTGQRYSATNLLNAVKTIESNYNSIQGNFNGGRSPANNSDQYASYRSQIPQGEVLIMRNGQIGTVPAGEFNPATDRKI